MRVFAALVFAACSFEPGRFGRDGAVATDDADQADSNIDAPLDAALVCPDSYAAQHPYRMIATIQTWLLAEQECEADSNGLTHLVVLDNDAERAAVAAAIQTLGDAWVGIVRDPGGTAPWPWHYVTGEPAAYAPWEGSEPNNVSGNQYVAVLRMSSGFLYDYGIDQQLAAVCECDFKPPSNADYDPALP